MFIRILIVSFLLALTSFNSNANQCESTCQLDKIKQYFAALDLVARQGSTIEDIDRLLQDLHDDVQYIHVGYQANFTKSTWREAFIGNLKRGAYQNSASQQQRILNSIAGNNYMAVEYAHGVIDADGNWQADSPQLVLFGFKAGKISLVQELW